ncbi:amino acid transporter [Lacticaseibacillus casei 21/1]|nr:amino acid transporter [Lacticaseibacillus casei 21/1]
MQEEELTPRRYMSWPVLSLLVFITVIGFENIFILFRTKGFPLLLTGSSC